MNGVAPSCRISETRLAVAQPKTPGKPKNSPSTGPNADAGRICTMSLNCGTARKPSRTARYATKQAANMLNDRFQPGASSQTAMAPAGLLTQRKLPAPPRHREQRLRAFHYVPVDPIPWCRTPRIRSLKRHPDSFALTITNVAGAEEDKPRCSVKGGIRETNAKCPRSHRERKGKPPTPADAVDTRAAAPAAGRMSSPSQARCRYAMHIRPIFAGGQ